MIGGQAGAVAVVVGGLRIVGERAEIVVEGMVLLHHDDDVGEFAQFTVGARCRRYTGQEGKRDQQ